MRLVAMMKLKNSSHGKESSQPDLFSGDYGPTVPRHNFHRRARQPRRDDPKRTFHPVSTTLSRRMATQRIIVEFSGENFAVTLRGGEGKGL